MAFRQLYYTSCAKGLAGYAGFQFNAATDGVSPVVMREVEDGSVYEPPRWMPGEPDADELAGYPVAFSHTTASTGATVVAQVAFAGADYSGRPGNYFAHALVTEDPASDFGPLLPVELWAAPVWRRTPVDDTVLPALPGPLTRGPVDRVGAAAFLTDNQVARDAGVPAALLTAVDRAMTGDRPVLLVNHEAGDNAWWIAVVCYLLGPRLARRLAFTTYSHRPGYSGHHIVGVVAHAGGAPSGVDSGFHLFDFTAGAGPGAGELPIHPVGELLARTGVMAAEALWQQAAALSGGTESDFAAWHAPLAAAAGLVGNRLTGEDLDVVAAWLPRAEWLPTRHVGVVLSMLVGQAGVLSDERLRDLLDVAVKHRAESRISQIESELSRRALELLARGESAPPFNLVTPAGREAVVQRCVELLERFDFADVLPVLEWAEASGARIPDGALEDYAWERFQPGTPGEVLVPLLKGRPAFVHGIITKLARGRPMDADALFGGPARAFIDLTMLERHPGLAERWLIGEAERGALPRAEVLDQIVVRRVQANRQPTLDRGLLTEIWARGCPPDDLIELLGKFRQQACDRPDVQAWFVERISETMAMGGDATLRLAPVLTGHPIYQALPGDLRNPLRHLEQIAPLLGRVERKDLSALPDLYGVFVHAEPEARAQMLRKIPPMLLEADPLAPALHRCPEQLFVKFTSLLDNRVRRVPPHDPALLARLFRAANDPRTQLAPTQARAIESTLERARDWGRKELKAVAKEFGDDAQMGERFQKWWHGPEHEASRFRRWPGKRG